jgi:threonine/homoserine/homoserine lactone efflux protein
MRLKILFWLAVGSAVVGIQSPDGNLFYFFAVHLTMLTIGFSLYRREKRARSASEAEAPDPKKPGAVSKV